MKEIKGLRALVTGASSGIGEAFARLLATRGADLVLTARRQERLEALAAELMETHEVAVETIPLDLAAPGAPAKLLAAARGEDGAGRIDILINNAGFGLYGPFTELSWQSQAEMNQLNITALSELCHLFLRPALAADERVWLLNVSSVGAFQPVPTLAAYAAGKAYVLSMSEALSLEVAGTKVTVSCLCPGGTRTEFFKRSGQTLGGSLQQRALMSAESCAAIGLAGLFRGKRRIVPGALNRVSSFMARHSPANLAGRVAERVIRP